MFYAHSTDDPSKSNWHRLRDHLIATGQRAAEFAASFGMGRAARLTGLLHDLGKYCWPFKIKITKEPNLRVDHSTAGAIMVRDLVKGEDAAIGELIAYAIAGHHAGLADWIGENAPLSLRLKKMPEPLAEDWRQEIAPEPTQLLPEGFQWHRPPAGAEFGPEDRAALAFQFSFLGRMIFSCLVDADFRDTEDFYVRTEGFVRDRNWPTLSEIIGDLTARFDGHMAGLAAGAEETPVNRLRADILAHVRGCSGDAPGLFTLTVPTGGGKTLASLGFALDHARAHGLERIVYAIPFTSIIDQTASIFRDVLGEEVVLEHHSAIEEEKPCPREQKSKLRLAMEDWAAPVVVTTNVQLFESLFANRPSRCRKLHNLAKSVIVLDEAQTLPRHLLRPAMEALRELTVNYGATVILCTATQPALDMRDLKGGLPLEGRELAPEPKELARRLQRTRVKLGEAMGDDDLVEALRRQNQGLVIVNTRRHALDLYRAAEEEGLDGLIHLTTRQYAAHRRTILADVRGRLERGEPCRVIATSLVEAGVDLDFPLVWRAETGLDQIAQAAGRCNREGKRAVGESVVTVFRPRDHAPPPEIKQLIGDFDRMAKDHEGDLLSPDAMRAYFGEVYWRLGEDLDAKGILKKFKTNGRELDFSYRSVAQDFRMIESGMAPIIIPREEKAQKALARLGSDGVSAGGVARDLQSFVVQVPPRARAKLLAAGHAAFVREKEFGDQFCVLKSPKIYEEDIGLFWENADYLYLDDSVF
jgi:CRISPR-associated endonuclease/helicase Cas3